MMLMVLVVAERTSSDARLTELNERMMDELKVFAGSGKQKERW